MMQLCVTQSSVIDGRLPYHELVEPRTTNPFSYGDLALDDAFTDRRAELKALEADMLNGLNVAIIAPRRYGKSSLVRRASQHLVSKGVLVAEVDLMKTPTKAKFAGTLAKAIHSDLASVLFKAKEQLRIFANLRVTPTITINPRDGSTSFSFTPTHDEEDIDATIERLLELPAQLAAEQRKRVVVYFDEFQEVVAIDPKLPSLMRAVFQEQPDVAHIYAGSKRDMMHRLFNHQNEPFYKSAKVMEIGKIAPELFTPFIRKRFDITDRGIVDSALDGLLDVTRGHPYATQELAYALWEEVPAGFTASRGDLERAIEAVVRAENAHFTLVWENAARAQRLVLQALADEPGRVQSGSYRARHGLPGASTVQRAVQALAGEELVARRPDGAVEIVEPFLKEWIVRHSS
jgi:uncharacterized protein